MAVIEWSPRLQLDVPAMDSEHKQLVELMARLEKQSTAHEAHEKLDATFRALGEATKKHFADEERYMRSIAYPEYTQHALIHQSLLEKFEANYARFKANKAGVDPGVFEFLTFWLRSHISGIDRRYADFAQSGRGAAAK